MKTDIQIAQEATLKPIKEVATLLGICEDDLELYGKYKAKINLDIYDELKDKKDGKLIAHSWLWRNGDLLCLDNIEVNKNVYDYNFLDVYKDYIIKSYRKHKNFDMVTLDDYKDISSMNFVYGINNEDYQEDLKYLKDKCDISEDVLNIFEYHLEQTHLK